MSLNEKFGRGSSSLNKVSVNGTPDINLLRRLLSDLSNATTIARCEISWQVADQKYSLSLTHSRLSARAKWKLYRFNSDRSTLLWSRATNDINALHRLILESHNRNIKSVKTQSRILAQQNRPEKTQTLIPSVTRLKAMSQDRRAININANLSGKLRKLFIGAQEEIITGSQLLPVGRSGRLSKRQTISKPATQFVDITPGKEVLHNLFIGQFGIFSYPTFLFFLEREYFHAIENKTPISLITFEAHAANIGDVSAIASHFLQEVARRIKLTQRKTDILAQYEEGKFVLLLPDTSPSGAKAFVRRLQKTLSLVSLGPDLGEGSIRFTFGIATLGEHCKTLHMFLTYADQALKLALKLEKDLCTDENILAQQSLGEKDIKSIDLTAARHLVAQLISVGIFTYRAFLAFLEQEYYRVLRKDRDLLVLILRVRQYEEVFDQPVNLLPDQAFHELIRRVGGQLNKRDIFAHYLHGNFIIMRSHATISQMNSLSKKIVQSIISKEWLTSECPVSSLVIRTQICIARAHPTATNLFCFVPAN